MKQQKIALIIRGVSGSGKSTFAETLKTLVGSHNTRICTADDYFHQDGEYKFDPTKLSAAHAYCFKKFEKHILEGTPLVIQNNTNTKSKDFQKYIDLAKERGYTVFSIVMENREGHKNVHGVPEEVIERQSLQLKQSIVY